MIVLRDMKKSALVSASIFVGILFVSLVFFLVDNLFTEKLLIFFPEHSGGRIAGEARTVVKQDSIEGDIELLVEEIILGPADIRHAGVLPRNTKVRSVVVREGAAYLDLSSDAIFLGEEVKMSFDEAVATVKKAVLFNSRRLRNVMITVDGQLPGEPLYAAPDVRKRPGEEKPGKIR